MITLLYLFMLSALFSFILTPLVRTLAQQFHLVDLPSDRKVHSKAVPRLGGVAIYLAFFLPLTLLLCFTTRISDLLVMDSFLISLTLGASVVFGLGLWDDISQLNPKVKFSIQVLAVLIAYLGGIRIYGVILPGMPAYELGWLSLPATLCWFLLIINGINFIDGLDGLAAGVCFISSTILLVLCLASQRFLLAMGLATMAGSCLGFLRYNFSPASIFMGDSGSYFLGYMLAALSIIGPFKSHAAATILIPAIVLGLPLVDAVLTTVRRLANGKAVFQPDREHLHHRLLRLGLAQRHAVILFYGITVVLGLAAFYLVHARDAEAGLMVLVLGTAVGLGIRKLGYIEEILRRR